MLIRKTKSAWRRVCRHVHPAERAFQRAWLHIQPLPGLLVSPHQERWMFLAARQLPDPANIVEIGSFKGRSTCCFGLAVKGTGRHIYCIDTFNGNDVDFHHRDFLAEFQGNIDRCGLTEQVTACRGLSHDVAKTWDRPIDLIFIDGSHQYEDVLADFENYFPFVKPGGVVAFHDVDETWPGVVKAWDQDVKQHLTDIGFCRTIAFGRKPV